MWALRGSFHSNRSEKRWASTWEHKDGGNNLPHLLWKWWNQIDISSFRYNFAYLDINDIRLLKMINYSIEFSFFFCCAYDFEILRIVEKFLTEASWISVKSYTWTFTFSSNVFCRWNAHYQQSILKLRSLKITQLPSVNAPNFLCIQNTLYNFLIKMRYFPCVLLECVNVCAIIAIEWANGIERENRFSLVARIFSRRIPLNGMRARIQCDSHFWLGNSLVC